ncbi:MAG: PAS domain-containing protein [Syntrophobacteraceae bacterium]
MLSEMHLREILDTLFDKVMILDHDFAIVETNKSCTAAYGGKTGDLIGKHCYEVLDGLDRPCNDPDSKCPAAIVLRTLKPAVMEHTYPGPGGEFMSLAIRAFPLFDALDGTVRVCMVLRNNTTRHKLLQADAFLINLIESSVDGIVAADMKGIVTIFNKGAERLLGYTAEEAIGKINVADFYPPGVAQDIMRKLRGERYGGRAKLLPHPSMVVTGDKELIPINLTGALIYEDDREIASVGIFYDLRETLRTQQKLIESENKFDNLFETVGQGLLVCNPDGKLLDCNYALIDMLGYEGKDEFLQVDVSKDLLFDPAFKEEFLKTMERQGHLKDYEVLFKKKDGEAITVLLTAHVRTDNSGSVVVGYHILIVDVTETHRLAQQLFESDKLAAMGRLTAQIAHELNNPIYGVMNCLDLLKSEIPEQNKKRKFLDMAHSEIHRISKLLRNMLSFIKPAEDVRSHVDVNRIIEDIILFMDKQLNDCMIKTVLDLDESLPKIYASNNQIRQVILNLLMNARTAMPKGGVLTITTKGMIDKILFKIADTGVGIPPEIRSKLFEPFLTTKSNVKGTGLGLSICFDIINRHKGTIEVESKLGVGTTFTVTIPAAPGKNEHNEVSPVQSPA